MVPSNGDFNEDGVVNAFDLSTLLSFWNTAEPSVDINGDGSINSFDLSIMVSNWGTVNAPAVPSNLQANASETEVALTWDTVSNTNTYSIKRATTSGGPYTTLDDAITTNSYTDTTVSIGTTYYYVVSASNTGGEGNNSSEASATPEDVTAPATPTGLQATAGEGEVALTWDANTEPDLDHYTIYRDSTEIDTVNAGTQTYTDTTVTNGTTYAYTISASDASANESAQTAAANATPEDVTAPATPTGLYVLPGDGQAILTWDANTEPDLDHYTIYRDSTEIDTVNAGTQTYTDTTVTNGTTYAYTISASDASANESAQTAAANATPQPGVIYLTPASATVANSQNLVVRVMVNTHTNEHDTAQVRILYDETKFTYVSFDDSASNYNTSAPSDAGTGYIELVKGNTSALSGEQIFGDVTFQAISDTGPADLTFNEAESHLILGGVGMNITTVPGSYELTA